MDKEVVRTLAGPVAVALVKAMARGLGQQLRNRIAKVLGRGDKRRERTVRDHLDESSTRVEAAPEDVREGVAGEVMAEWRGTLHVLLAEHPDAAQELQAVLLEMDTRRQDRPAEVSVTQTATATRKSVVYQVGRDLNGGPEA